MTRYISLDGLDSLYPVIRAWDIVSFETLTRILSDVDMPHSIAGDTVVIHYDPWMADDKGELQIAPEDDGNYSVAELGWLWEQYEYEE